ncbi:PadR family transcriptional regulator [soil metagenome]
MTPMTRPNPEPLTPLSLAILLALVDEDRHGYGIMKEIERLTDGEVQAGAGSLYAALQRMTVAGLIDEAPYDPAPDEDARRRYYQLTEQGRETARAEMLRMVRALRVARRKRLLPGLRLSVAAADR